MSPNKRRWLNANDPITQRMNRLIRWMHKGGADTSKLGLHAWTNNFRGVHATEDIEAGETILFVPDA